MSRFDGRIDTIEARGDTALGRHNLLTFGYEFEREAFDNPARNEDPDPFGHIDVRLEVEQRSHAVFAQNQLRLMDGRLQFSLSGRLQSFDLSQPEFTGGGSPYEGTALPSPQSECSRRARGVVYDAMLQEAPPSSVARLVIRGARPA